MSQSLQPAPHYRPFLTCSGVDRFLACASSVTQPQVRGEFSELAQAGTVEHADRLRPGQLPRKVLDWFGGKEPVYEAAMAVDLSLQGTEVRYLGQNIERDYGTFSGPSWLCGSGDALDITGDVVSTGDLKTGRGQASGSLSRPELAGQLLSLSDMTIRLRQVREPTWRPSRIRLMWWLTADRADDLVDAEVTYDYLMDWAYALRKRVHLAQAGGVARLARGSHCGLCPAFDACPAQGGAVRRVAELSGRVQRLGEMTSADLYAAFLDIAAAEKTTAAAKAALRLRVQHGGAVAVDEGHELRLVQGTDSRIDPNVALEVLGDRFLDCADVTVSQAGMRRALGVSDVSSIVEEIRARGGVREAPKAPYLRVLRKHT